MLLICGAYQIFGRSFITENDGSTWTYPQDTQQPFDQSRIDLDPATPGQQLILDRSVSDGWIIRYDPIEDILSSEVTNEELFPKPQTLILPYTLVPAIGCADPVPGKLIIQYTDLG